MIELPELKHVVTSELNPPLKVTRIVDTAGLEKLEDFFARTKAEGGVVGWDIETTPLRDFFYRRVRTVQFGNLTEQYVIDLLSFCDGNADTLFHAQGNYGANLHKAPRMAEVISTIAPILCTNEFLKVGVNLGFEYLNFYWNLGLRTWHFWDCAMVEKCIYAGASPLKRYATFSMEEMMARYFQLKIDKMYQESFTLDANLIDDQINYAALDTRFPLAIRAVQMLILKGTTYKQLVAAGKPAQKYLRYIDPLVTGDDLREIAQIENDAIGAFEDMHVHGERLDRTRWLTRVQKCKDALLVLLEEELDPVFLPIVGSKLDIITDEQIETARQAWKVYADPTPEEKAFLRVSPAETEISALIRKAEKLGNIAAIEQLTAEKAKIKTDREAAAAALKAIRDEKKEFLKKEASELGKRRTKIKNLIKKCEGQALINYGSDKQLLKVLVGMKGFKNLTNLDDDVLAKYPQSKVMCAIREYHSLSKEIGTYGDAWATEFVTKPCKEEGWLNPGDGRLHGVFNQYDAETGRSSSEKPNCFSDDTQVLTTFGWIPFPEVISKMHLAQYDRTTGEISFAHPLAVTHSRHESSMVSIKSDLFIDMLVTADHDMPLRNRKSGNWKTFKASNYPSDKHQVVAGTYKSGYIEYTQDQITIMCAIQADAHIKENGTIDWGFTKERKYTRLKNSLETCGIAFIDASTGGRFRVYVKAENIPVWMQSRKFWDDDLLTFSSESLAKLSEEIYHWDGCLDKGSMYSSSTKNNTDWMQIISILTGKRANFREYHNGNPNSVMNYQIDVTRQDYALTTNASIDSVPYCGFVHCVSMPLGTVIVRRNGIVAITGNCQNLPQDKEVRGCFIADPPDESIRVSNCCEADALQCGTNFSGVVYFCTACKNTCETHAEEYMLVSCDMSGAELRIIAELANDPVWIGAFERDEDVHSVCTELLYPEKWPALALPNCAYYKLREDGTPQHKKCKCPEHNSLRDDTKAVNFLLAYGGGPTTLASRIGVKREKAQELLDIHAARFPRIWAYLEDSGKKAKVHKKSFDMFGRRRLFPEPTMDRARDYFIKDKADRLELEDDEATDNVVKWNEDHPGEKPDDETLFWLTHRKPTNKEVMGALVGLGEGIGRQGKNHPIQSANATLAKIAMGCGFDSEGKPFLWHILPKLRAKLVKFVHDELVIQAPKQLAQKVADEIQSAFRRAAAMRMKKVIMESEYHIETFWSK